MSVLEWVTLNVSGSTPRSIHSTTLNKVFGQQQHPLGAWLRRHLLIPRTGYLSAAVAGDAAHAIGYTLNPEGLFKVASMVELTIDKLDLLSARYINEIVTGDFVYSDKQHRLWHHLQQLKRDDRVAFWAAHGYHHHYDIIASAPNIILQTAIKRGIPAILIPTCLTYLRDRTAFRERISTATGIPVTLVKDIINGLFFGARLTPHYKCGIFVALDSDEELLERLVRHPEIAALRREIGRVWIHIERADAILSHDAPDARWRRYFKEERRVLDVIRRHCVDHNIKVFCIHDGVITSAPLDITALKAAIRAGAGYILGISQTV